MSTRSAPDRLLPTSVARRTVDLAVAGRVDFAVLTTAERRIVVRRLAVDQRMSDLQIARHLRWAASKPAAHRRSLVHNFRRNWLIPAGGRKRGTPAPDTVRPARLWAATRGEVPADQLTASEKRQAVRFLAVYEHLTDREIADRLRWTPHARRAQRDKNVANFRGRHNIPAGRSAAANPPAIHDRPGLVKAA